MTFTQNDYLSWYRPRLWRPGDACVDLHSSGVAWVSPAELTLPDGDAATMAERFEVELASWLGLPRSEVIFTPGATGGTLLALLSFSGLGSEFVVETPVYEPLLRQAERLGRVHRVRRCPETAWRLPVEEMVRTIDKRCSAVLITEPHNPSGMVSPSDDIRQLAHVAASKGAILVVNEVYRGFTGTASFHGLADNVVVVSSFSKLLGAYWARVGWVSAANHLIEQLRAAHWNMSIQSAAGARAGLAFLSDVDERTHFAVTKAKGGVGIVDAWIHQQENLAWYRPHGSGFGLVSLPPGIDDLFLAERLHDEDGVLLVPGTWFQAPGTIRICWMQSGNRLQEGLDAVSKRLSAR